MAPLKWKTFIAFLALMLSSPPVMAVALVSFSETETGVITVKAEDSPLGDLIREVARRCSIDLKAPSMSNEVAYLDVTANRIEDILRKLLRGYNYVFIEPNGSSKGSLTVLGKAQRTETSHSSVEAVTSQPVPIPPASTVRRSAGVVTRSSPRRVPAATEEVASYSALMTASGRATRSTSSAGVSIESPPAIPAALINRPAKSQGSSSSTSGDTTPTSNGSSGSTSEDTTSLPVPPMPPSIPRH